MPSARRPSLLTATCSAVIGSGFASTAFVTGAVTSQAFAAARFFTRSSTKLARGRCLNPKRSRPCMSS